MTEAAGSARRWAPKAALSVADQGLATGAHFLLTVLLARWLAPSEYGAFAVAFSVFLFAWGLHSAVLVEPMSIVGPSYHEARLSAYIGAAIWIHGGLTTAMLIALLVVAGVLAALGSAAWPAMLGMSLACPFLLLMWLLRRACYLKTKPAVALRGSALYFMALLAGIAAMRCLDKVSPFHAFLVLGLSSLGISLVFCRLLGVEASFVLSAKGRSEVATVMRQHWRHGKWFLRTTVMYWLASSLYLPAVGVLSGLEAVAAFRAIENLFRPMSQTLTALSLLFLPYVSARSEREGTGRLMRTAVKTSAAMFVLTGSYAAAVFIGGKHLIRAMYGGSYYCQFLSLIPFLGIALVLRGIGDNGFAVPSKAANWPDIIFWATLLSAGTTLVAGLYLVKQYGATGAAMGWMLSSAVHVAATVWLFVNRLGFRRSGYA